MMYASDVSFSSTTSCAMMIGSMCRNACGNSIENRVCSGVSPIASPDFALPRGRARDARPQRLADDRAVVEDEGDTPAQNDPVENTSRMKSIISSTGMPRKNSTTIDRRASRTIASRAVRAIEKDHAEDQRADRGDRCHLQSVPRMPRQMNRQNARSRRCPSGSGRRCPAAATPPAILARLRPGTKIADESGEDEHDRR